jgi:hypothetical protein
MGTTLRRAVLSVSRPAFTHGLIPARIESAFPFYLLGLHCRLY